MMKVALAALCAVAAAEEQGFGAAGGCASTNGTIIEADQDCSGADVWPVKTCDSVFWTKKHREWSRTRLPGGDCGHRCCRPRVLRSDRFRCCELHWWAIVMVALSSALGFFLIFIVGIPAYCDSLEEGGRGGGAVRPARQWSGSLRQWSVRGREPRRVEMVEDFGHRVPHGTAVDAAVVGAPGDHALSDEIARLGALRDEGLLSDAEFAAAKRKVLGV